ncbi:amino acid ABC transporter permease [Actinomadura fulvescens]|uniref:Amino acid ABC transporter permease n=1 Tax=Actinomadura fulvescens TaxID=46160 RepID=A0ABP6C6J6_9ACTN
MSDSTTVAEPAGPAGSPPGRTGLSPRQRRRLSLAIQYVLLLAAVALVASLADWTAIRQNFFKAEVAKETLPDLFTVALKNTVIFTLSGFALGFAFGLVLALMRLSSVAPYRWVSVVYIEIFRGVPMLLIFLIILFLPAAFPGFQFPFEPYGQVAVGLGLVAAAYMAETFRAGIQAVPKGQMEAARSLGMPYMRAMGSIVIPQAIRIVLPPIANQLVLLFKDSSLVFVLGLSASTVELTKFGSDLATDHANGTPLMIAGLTYLLVTVPASILVQRLEVRQAKAR